MPTSTEFDLASACHSLETDGIVGLRGAFSREWTDRLREDIEELFAEALARPDGAVGRGPNRYYVEIHPERLRGFVDIVTHPWVTGISASVLGPGYRFVEVGFDVPLPGAVNQPWHRDFRSPPETYEGRRITSLAFNLTAVDTVPEMGPFEIAPGTHWDPGHEFEHGMFPPRSEYARYQAIAVPKLPQRGDISARTALTLHRGTANVSTSARPVLIVGVVSASVTDAGHQLVLSDRYHRSLPESVRDHLDARIVEELTPLQQRHTIEGLVMGDA